MDIMNMTAMKIFSCGEETTRDAKTAQKWIDERRDVEVVLTDGNASAKIPIQEVICMSDGRLGAVTVNNQFLIIESIDLGLRHCSVIKFWADNAKKPQNKYAVEERVAKAIVLIAATSVRAEVQLENGTRVLTSKILKWIDATHFKTINGSVYSYTVVEE